jgi:signal transduction histidine kinase
VAETKFVDCLALAERGNDEGRLCSGICFAIGRKSRREFLFQDRVTLRQSMINDGGWAGEVIGRIRVTKSPSQRGRLSINNVIVEVVTLLSAEIQRNRISLQTELSSDLPLIMGDRVQLQQVILNLMMNAVDAMSQTGQSQRELSVVSGMDGSDAVLVTVRDSGPGLDETALERP